MALLEKKRLENWEEKGEVCTHLDFQQIMKAVYSIYTYIVPRRHLLLILSTDS